MAASYEVELERDERGWWVASVPAVPGAYTQGRSIAQAMNRIREALSLWKPGAERADLIPEVHLPATARAIVRRAASARARAERAEEEAAGVLRDAIRELTERENLSTRDVAGLLELSPSRVDQLKPGREGGIRRGDPGVTATGPKRAQAG
jgi:predicted RNase H-like HicB family nuclease